VNELQAVVFIVDDDPSLCKALGRLLDGAGYRAETFASAEEFLRRERVEGPACLLLDLSMPGMDGLALQTHLAGLGWEPSIVFLTGHGQVRTSVQAMKAGAVDFLTKPVDEAVLLSAVSDALERQRARLEQQHEQSHARARLAGLTPREREVAAFVVEGRRNKQIAFELGIAEKTVKVHRGRVMDKTGARSAAELVQLWMTAARDTDSIHQSPASGRDPKG